MAARVYIKYTACVLYLVFGGTHLCVWVPIAVYLVVQLGDGGGVGVMVMFFPLYF